MKKGKYTFYYIASQNEVQIYLSNDGTDEVDTFDTVNSIIEQVKREYGVSERSIFISYAILTSI
jgi:trehalose-6-phosphatase